jgi:hypothetical protein
LDVLDIVFKILHKPGCPASIFLLFIHDEAGVDINADKALGAANEKSTVRVPNPDPRKEF